MKYLHTISESLRISDQLYYILNSLSEKGNKVAQLLLMLKHYDAYPDEELLNSISTTKEFNIISFLQYDRYKKISSGSNYEYEDEYRSNLRSEMRIGRAVKKIIDVAKKNSKFNFKGKCKVFCDGFGNHSLKVESKYFDPKIKNFYIVPDGHVFEKTKVKLILDGVDYSKYCIYPNVSLNGTDPGLEITISNSEVYLKMKEIYPRITGYYSSFVILPSGETTKKNEIGYDFNCILSLRTPVDINDSDIEKFVNEYVAFYKSITSDKNSKITEVKGNEIIKWYNRENYQNLMGKLGNSCMSSPDNESFFGIYTDNPDSVSLLIIKNDNDKLFGRALLWKTTDGYFMDRCYTINDYDDNLFYDYAIKKGYLYRSSNLKKIFFKDGKEIDEPKITVILKNYDFSHYPYLDTLCYLDDVEGTLSNINPSHDSYKTLHDTEGRWTEYREDDDLDYDDY